jgi:hypothetical protein
LTGSLSNQQVTLALARQHGQPSALAQGAQQAWQAVAQVRRSLLGQVTQHVADLVQHGVVGRQHLGVAAAILAEFLLGALQAAAQLQVFGVADRQEVGDRPLQEGQAVVAQAHVGDDLGIEQADRVAGDGVAEAGMELLGHRGPADHAARLADRDLQPGLGQVEGADQPVVPPADDHRVAGLGGGHGRSPRSVGRRLLYDRIIGKGKW